MIPLKFFAAIGITTTTWSAQTTAQDARRTGSPFRPPFPERASPPRLQNSAKDWSWPSWCSSQRLGTTCSSPCWCS